MALSPFVCGLWAGKEGLALLLLCSDAPSPGIIFGGAHVDHFLSHCLSGGAQCCFLTLCWQGCSSGPGELVGCWGEDGQLWEDLGIKGDENGRCGLAVRMSSVRVRFGVRVRDH